MSVTVAFDVYGTLIDTQGVVATLRSMIGDAAEAFSVTWREKQLEYSFRRGLMQNYENFAVCTRDALDYTCERHDKSLDEDQKQALLERYRTLPAFDDVRDGLDRLEHAGYRLFAFSNGSAEAVEELLEAAGIRPLFRGVVSTDELRSFKPNPAVYAHFLRRAQACGDSAWLISGNPFDVIGAISAGMHAAWVKRSETAIYDPWGIAPTVTVSSLCDLEASISQYHAGIATKLDE